MEARHHHEKLAADLKHFVTGPSMLSISALALYGQLRLLMFEHSHAFRSGRHVSCMKTLARTHTYILVTDFEH